MPWGIFRRAATTALMTTAAAVALAGSSIVASAGVANAEAGLSESGTATYVASDDGKPIRVTQKVTVTNRKASTATTFYYWDGYALWLPSGGTGVKVTSNGATLSAKVSTHEGQKYADIDFPRRLQYGQSRTFTVTYTIPGSPPRSDASGRVGKGYAALEVFSPGDAGQATIEVVAPRTMGVDMTEKWTETARGDDRVSTIAGGGPHGLWSRLSLRDSSQTLTREVTVDDHTFTVVGFPGDTAWVDHIEKNLPRAVRELEKLTGQDWPYKTTNIAEDSSRQVYGWDGVYRNGNISISEAIDPSLLAHELSHAWANDNLAERWLSEGLAQELTTQVMRLTKNKDEDRDRVRPTQKDAIPLIDWEYNASAKATETEEYGYPASWNAVHALVEGSTPQSRPELFNALTTKRTIYDVPSDASLLGHATTWEQAHDLFEVVGGNTKTRSIMQSWVVGPAKKRQFDARAAARKTYLAHEKLDGAWGSPRGVRQAMAEWNFAAAQTFMGQTKDLATQAASAQAAATKAGLDPKGLRTAYEQADSTAEYDAARKHFTTFASHATSYGELRTSVEDANPMATLGALALRPEAALDDARAAITAGKPEAATRALESAEAKTGLATLVGGLLLLGLPALLAALVLLLRRIRGRRRRQPPAPTAPTAPLMEPVVVPEPAQAPASASAPTFTPTPAPVTVPVRSEP
ncbi:hypothetical protein N802_06955 [Knoellia sinensis KCTC 19936]|uniref:Peptidase M1 membrane alanine aminopeptidase domain-containing protein n=1 Tax=Knoellia sinensis KCTC 19936 TaxID=1385520 RepID=A0A0A0IZH3_9MICO|nr:hypothetical protein [Knoellia sinensis]KGN30550.1 hypothetical protein N802_06955 [Knoellia sinensis KCTC 19936]